MPKTLILGASSTLGRSVADSHDRLNSELILTARSQAGIEQLACSFPGAEVLSLDVVDEDSRKEFVSSIFSIDDQINKIVIAFGGAIMMPLPATNDWDILNLFQINTIEVIKIIKDLLPQIQSGKSSSIVLIGSVVARVGLPCMTVYSATKAAVAGFSRSLAVELAPKKIRVNTVEPGLVESPMMDDMFKFLSQEAIKEIEREYPLGFGRPDQVANVVNFLLSDDSSWINGATIPVDGGYSAR